MVLGSIESFGWIMQKIEFIGDIGIVQSYLGKWGKRVNFESFGWILLNLEFICVIGTVPIYLGKWEKRMNFGNSVAEIQ